MCSNAGKSFEQNLVTCTRFFWAYITGIVDGWWVLKRQKI